MGNAALARAVLQRTRAEAGALRQLGMLWHQAVWIGQNDASRATSRTHLLAHMNSQLSGVATFSRGWMPYDPVVRTGRAAPYSAIVEAAAGQPDGGVAWATQFRNWMTGDAVGLLHLPADLRALALITHWAEVGRGYGGDLGRLVDWMDQIIAAPNAAAAAALWRAVTTHFPAALTYREDTRRDYDPDDDDSTGASGGGSATSGKGSGGGLTSAPTAMVV